MHEELKDETSAPPLHPRTRLRSVDSSTRVLTTSSPSSTAAYSQPEELRQQVETETTTTMAEAAAAVGVAAAAVQFFEFSLKTLTLCKQIHDNEKGATEANQELEASIGKLKQIAEDLQLNVVLPAVDRPITTARHDCVATIGDLEKLLNDVKPRSRKRAFATARSALRAIRSKPKIEALQNQLSEAQRRFLAAASVETRNDVARLLEEQGKSSDKMLQALLPELRTAYAASARGHAKTYKELLDISTSSTAAHKTTHGLLSEVQKGHEATLKEHKTLQTTLSRDLAAIEAQADMQHSVVQTTSKYKELLDSLYYPEMFERQQSIKPPSFGTFQWIFDSSPPVQDDARWSPGARLREDMRGVFARWLGSNEPLFWISGKAGSGKSSLMSLIQSDPRTATALTPWSNGLHVYKFSFYFWRPGTELQKSICGLLRSLLYQLVKAKPAIFDLVVSTNPALYNGWTTTSLLAALRCSLPAFHEDRVFLMVDGLDEYEDQHDAGLLELMLDCQHMSHVKTCLASRPETAILAKLKDYPSLRLQDLNAHDIETFVRGKLTPLGRSVTEELTMDVIERAAGVFLWAALVTKSMESGALAGDDPRTLQLRLESTPVELDALFEQLLANMDKVHYETLSLCLFHLGQKVWGDFDDMKGSIALITAAMSASKCIDSGEGFLSSCLETSGHVVAQCKGLIEVHHKGDPKSLSNWTFDFRAKKLRPADANAVAMCYSHHIRFVHRSAFDFFFGDEGQHGGRLSQTAVMIDIGQLLHQTLDGLKLLLKHGPMVLDGSMARNYFRMGVSVAVSLASSFGVDLTPWLDDIYNDLPTWYPHERMHIRSSMAKECSLRGDWEIEDTFWHASSIQDGYLSSRWNTLMQSPHAKVFCSTVLRSSVYDYGRGTTSPKGIDEWLHRCKRLIAVLSLSEASSGQGIVTAVAHVRITDPVSSEILSCDARGRMDEQTVKVFNNLRQVARQLWALPSTSQIRILDTELYALFRKLNLHLGVELTSVRQRHMKVMPLQIQTNWALRRRPQQSDGFFRILCLADVDWIRGYTDIMEQYGKDVVSLFDTRIESLEALQEDVDSAYSAFPRFQGTQEDFSDCLEQILSKVRADEQGQLDAWQQLYTLACVKTGFKYFWTIRTAETQWLAQITL
jgi:hypothetical protein